MPARPEIFISATSKNLKSCRKIVSDALLTLGCVPVVQDHCALGAGEVRVTSPKVITTMLTNLLFTETAGV